MLPCFTKMHRQPAVVIMPVIKSHLKAWVKSQTQLIQHWVHETTFKAESGELCLIRDQHGQLKKVLIGLENDQDFWSFGKLPLLLPEGVYCLEDTGSVSMISLCCLAWGLGSYQFTVYKKAKRKAAKLLLPAGCDEAFVNHVASSIHWVRDLINTPANDMTPTRLAEEAKQLAVTHQAVFHEIVGEELLAQNYPAIYMVGKGSVEQPRLVELRWGDEKYPKVTLVGKGVCFDSGGLDLKSSPNMLLMKKDMAGAAHVLGLSKMIMTAQLKIHLRVLIPIVENMLSGEAYRPGDVIRMRDGQTVEVTSTDAEGRLILADALTEAVIDKPDLLIDFASLTGAARDAFGAEMTPFFSNQDELAQALLKIGKAIDDPAWLMPLHRPYLDFLKSKVADWMNVGGRQGGAITAALFLELFIKPVVPWIHFDMIGFNLRARPGRPEGGEAMGLRLVFEYLKERFGA